MKQIFILTITLFATACSNGNMSHTANLYAIAGTYNIAPEFCNLDREDIPRDFVITNSELQDNSGFSRWPAQNYTQIEKHPYSYNGSSHSEAYFARFTDTEMKNIVALLILVPEERHQRPQSTDLSPTGAKQLVLAIYQADKRTTFSDLVSTGRIEQPDDQRYLFSCAEHKTARNAPYSRILEEYFKYSLFTNSIHNPNSSHG